MDEMLGHVAELKTKLKLNLICFKKTKSMRVPRGLMARILGFHPRGPGSIPGVGDPLFDHPFFSSKNWTMLCGCSVENLSNVNKSYSDQNFKPDDKYL